MSALLIPLFLALGSAASATPQQPLSAESLAEGLTNPHTIVSAPGDDVTRLFLATQPGRVRILENGAVRPVPFLDISSICLLSYEEGLNCIAFHPDYLNNRKFYVTYCDLNGDWILAQYLRDPADPNLADPNSGQVVLVISHPSTIHYSGWMEFGLDGYLYLCVGDGGPQEDPLNHAQRGDVLLGKLLRLDMDNPSPGLLYGIPPGNPFVNDPNFRGEIWALGLRNPWRCDVDDLTGDIWIGDVGLGSWEELDFLAAGTAGANLGWRLMEGNHCHRPAINCDPGGLTYPIFEWLHGGVPYHCSITGGQVYRGRAMADMQGRYFFSDYCSGEVWSLRWDGQQVVDFIDHTPDLIAALGPDPFIIGFGTDADGELCLGAQNGGKVFRLIPAGLRLRVPRLTAGSAASLRVTNGTPSSTVGFFYSRLGLGSTVIPQANVSLGIANGLLIVAVQTDAAGRVTVSGTLPLGLQDRTIWIQAAQIGQTSNIWVETVD